MKKTILLFAAALLVFMLPSVSFAGKARSSAEPSATLQKFWIDYDVTVNGVNGMRLHADFTTYGLKGVSILLLLTVQDDECLEFGDEYDDCDLTGAAIELKPGFETAEYKDISTFIPYSEFELGEGEYDLVVDVDVTYPDSTQISHLKLHDFKYSNKSSAPQPDAEFVSKSVDYGVTRDGRTGMLLHVTLDQVKGMKGVSGAVTVRIDDSLGVYVPAATQEFSVPGGFLEARFTIKPVYDPAKFDDIQIFIPYSEISVGKGKHKLKLDIDLKYADGKLIKHLAFHEFEFTR